MLTNDEAIAVLLVLVIIGSVVGTIYIHGFRRGMVCGWKACRDGIEPPPPGTEETP